MMAIKIDYKVFQKYSVFCKISSKIHIDMCLYVCMCMHFQGESFMNKVIETKMTSLIMFGHGEGKETY